MADAGRRIREAAGHVLQRFVSAGGLDVDYAGLSGSAEFSACEDAVADLAAIDPAADESCEERLAFWINLYNLAAIRAAAAAGIKASVREAADFFDRPVCNVGGRDLSLNDIEYGIIRGNARRSYRVLGQFWPGDSRLRLVLDPPEPLAGFALVRCTRSSPALRLYDSLGIEGQLYGAAVGFISRGGVVIDRERDRILLPRLFRDYARDFGGGLGTMRLIADHLEPHEDSAWIRSHAGKARVTYLDADWRLNGIAVREPRTGTAA